MAAGTWTLSCLLLIAGATPPDATRLSTRDFSIPISFNPNQQKNISKVILVVSRDQGANYTTQSIALPEDTQFNVLVKEDGLYYFTIVVDFKDGTRQPTDPRDVPLDKVQKVLVDTTGAAPAALPVAEPRPAPPPETAQPINYNTRIEKDYTPRGQDTSMSHMLDPVPPPLPSPMDLAPPSREPWNDPQKGNVVPSNFTNGLNSNVVARSDAPDPPRAVAPSATPPRSPRTSLPNLQKVNKRQVVILYEVSRYGPAGIGSVEVYLTKDDGHTWAAYSAPQPLDAPLPPGSQGTSVPLQQSLTVTLPDEGLFGLFIVVKNRAGLGKPPPQPGDAPQIRVEVDETSPHCELYGPMPDPGQRDAVVITWKAWDNRPLGATPVTLEWAAERDTNDWHLISGELPNTGRFSWRVPPGTVPPKVFLRMTVRDEAGNTALATTNQEVLIDLTEPEITIKDLRVAGPR